MTTKEKIEISKPINQEKLYGYKNYFDTFRKLYESNNLPHVILLTGQKGIGKSTFAYHFINFLLSQKEENKYFYDDLTINLNSQTTKLLKNHTHPNFFLLDNNDNEEHIKINQSRNLIRFLNLSTYNKDLKIVLLDNAEHLNPNSSNALLKSLEEYDDSTFFFIINNISSQISETIKSRCIEFKLRFNQIEKEKMFKQLIQDYQFNIHENNISKFLYFDSPGNIITYLLYFYETNLDIFNDHLSCILYLIELCKTKKDLQLLSFISIFVENFYGELMLYNKNNFNIYYHNKSKILHMIHNMKTFNLDKKNLLISISKILENEKR